jgi:hypothetical protein
MARRIHGGQVGESSVGPIQVSTTSEMSPPINQDMIVNLQGSSRFVVNGTATKLLIENVQSGNYTIALSDQNKVVAMDNTSAATITVPLDSTVDFPVGSVVYILRSNTGNVTLEAESGVTLSDTGQLGPGEEIAIRKRGTNTWSVLEERKYAREGTGGNTILNQNDAISHAYTTAGASTFTVL